MLSFLITTLGLFARLAHNPPSIRRRTENNGTEKTELTQLPVSLIKAKRKALD
jgi:hypothetical protein